MIHWVLWHNAVCENKCDRAATWLARDLHTSLVLLPALTCNTTCACVCVCVCAFPAYLVLRVIESRWHISICMKGVKSERDAALYAGSCNGSGFSVFYIRCSRADRDEKKETAGKTNKANQNQADPNSDSSRAWWYRAFLIAVPQASDIYQIFKKKTKKNRLWWCSHCCLNSNMCFIIFSAWLQGQSTERSRAAETLQLQTVYKRWPSQAHWSLRVQVLGGNMLVL